MDSDGEGPAERCGFVLEPGDVPEHAQAAYVPPVPSGKSIRSHDAGSDEWYEGSEAACCWREVWDGADEGRCIWHAETDDKPADALVEARADRPERLDGAFVPAVEFGDGIDFEDCRVWAITFDGTSLQGASFAGIEGRLAQFSDVDLRYAKFPAAYLSMVRFPNTDLLHAEFRDADLRRAQFPDADLREAKFPDADLWGAEFPDANLRRAQFPDAILRQAQFPDAALPYAQFPDANLVEAQFTDTDLYHTQFPDAYVRHAQFLDADLRGAQFPDAFLRATTFTDANLEGVDLTGTNLFDAALRGTDLYGATFEDASINRNTTFGAHYVPAPARGVLARLGRVRTVGRELWLAVAPGRADSDDEDRLGKAAWTYRTIERLSQNAGLSKQARSYNVQRKDVERRLYLVEDGSRWRWGMAMLSSLSMRYGQSPWRVVGLSVLAIVAAAVGYMWQGLRLTAREPTVLIGGGSGTVPLPTLIGKSLYFSTITFTTVGYGDIQPVGWSQTIATLESFLGALLMALLVYVLGRRATW